MDKPESFEVQEYNDVREPYDTYKVLKQIVQDRKDEDHVTTHSIRVDFVGDQMKVFYQCYEMMLPHRMAEVEKQASDAHREFLSYLKKEFKKRAKHPLSVTEQKDLADYTVQKVSLNERYYYCSWRYYTIK
jgi:NADH:ubiquinone oxidoreductase subunit D